MILFKRKKVDPVKKVVRSTVKGDPDHKGTEQSIFTSLRFFLLFSQILGMLPQENVNGDSLNIHFKLLSWRILYSVVLIASFGVAVGCCCVHWILHGSNIDAIATGIFYGGSLATMILYLQLAISWSKLMKSWYSIDKAMNIEYGYPEKLNTTIKVFTVIFLFLGLADYLLSVGNRYEKLNGQYGDNLTALIYYEDTFPQLFAYIPYSIGTAIFCTIITIHSNLTWASNDLFIIVTSTALAMRFKQICQKLHTEHEKPKGGSLLFWKEIREDYDRLTTFCKELDSYISPIILLSYFLNIFFLLIQLYHTLEPISFLFHKTYFIFSFVYLIFKTTTVSLYAAWINDESKGPANILNAVDSSLYNVEIRRLLTQISFDKTALTGCKMFSVKRGIILSVASAIVTYELVLIQFSQANLYDGSDGNNSKSQVKS